MTDKPQRNTLRQSPKKAVFEQQAIYQIIDDALYATVSIIDNHAPFSIPMAVARIDDAIYLHGLKTSRLMRNLASGQQACISITHIDGIVVARSGFHCSNNYRSVMIHGSGKLVEGEEKTLKLEQLVQCIIPNSAEDYRPMHEKEVKATSLVSFELNEMACKVRTGDPIDDEADIHLPYWAGTIPVTRHFGAPINASNLPDNIKIPEYAKNYQRPNNSN